MKRTSGYFSRITMALLLLPALLKGQDTVNVALRFGGGIALAMPISAATGVYPRGFEVNGYYDLNERITIAADGGSSRFLFENYNYKYENSGVYFRAGVDYNLLNPVMSAGRYFAGASLKYGLSIFSHQSPEIVYDSYWGEYSTSAPKRSLVGHFLEISPGIRSELFSNLFIGWSVNVRVLLGTGAGDHLRAVDIPGFGNGSRAVSSGFNYYISYRIPYRTKRVIYIKPERDIEEETGTIGNNR
jgi:hypothetical protein